MKRWVPALLVVCCCAAIYADLALAEIKSDYGASFRLRQEYWENVTDLGALGQSDRDFFRLRSQLWGKVDLNKDYGAYMRLTNEAKYYLGAYKPFATSHDPDQADDRFDIDELIIDNLYFDARSVFGAPVDLRVGRQDFLGAFGEGFIMLDGTPGDGSRSFYFNAVKATWRINPSNAVDFVYVYQPKKEEFLPSMYPSRSSTLSGYVDNKKLLNASDERGALVYFRSDPTRNIHIEPYYMYKVEDPVGANKKLELNTLGGRAVFTFDNWKIRAEYGHQFGEYANNRDRKADGGYIFAGQKFDTVFLKPEWELGVVYLSGDDPSTAEHEGWDPLFSRGPMWNELLIYTMISETARDGGPIPGYWTNMWIYQAGLKLALASATSLKLSYQYLRSAEVTSGLNSAEYSNNSKDRGHLGLLILNHAFTKKLDGMLQLEYFIPGDFYTSKAEDAIFARWQLQYKF